jgi:hypothetical protein
MHQYLDPDLPPIHLPSDANSEDRSRAPHPQELARLTVLAEYLDLDEDSAGEEAETSARTVTTLLMRVANDREVARQLLAMQERWNNV